MKVLDLQCEAAHSFEGWFGSEQDYQDQVQRGLLACPMCASTRITKKLSAPRLNLRSGVGHAKEVLASESAAEPDKPAASTQPLAGSSNEAVAATAAQLPQLQAHMLTVMREVWRNTEDVGDTFADQARAMHYGEVEAKAIRGQASREQVVELVEEGIDVLPLVLPDAVKTPLQ